MAKQGTKTTKTKGATSKKKQGAKKSKPKKRTITKKDGAKMVLSEAQYQRRKAIKSKGTKKKVKTEKKFGTGNPDIKFKRVEEEIAMACHVNPKGSSYTEISFTTGIPIEEVHRIAQKSAKFQVGTDGLVKVRDTEAKRSTLAISEQRTMDKSKKGAHGPYKILQGKNAYHLYKNGVDPLDMRYAGFHKSEVIRDIMVGRKCEFEEAENYFFKFFNKRFFHKRPRTALISDHVITDKKQYFRYLKRIFTNYLMKRMKISKAEAKVRAHSEVQKIFRNHVVEETLEFDEKGFRYKPKDGFDEKTGQFKPRAKSLLIKGVAVGMPERERSELNEDIHWMYRGRYMKHRVLDYFTGGKDSRKLSARMVKQQFVDDIHGEYTVELEAQVDKEKDKRKKAGLKKRLDRVKKGKFPRAGEDRKILTERFRQIQDLLKGDFSKERIEKANRLMPKKWRDEGHDKGSANFLLWFKECVIGNDSLTSKSMVDVNGMYKSKNVAIEMNTVKMNNIFTHHIGHATQLKLLRHLNIARAPPTKTYGEIFLTEGSQGGVYQQADHIVLSTYRRKKFFSRKIENHVKDYILEACVKNGVLCMHVGMDAEHTHMILSIPPSRGKADIIGRIKRHVNQRFTEDGLHNLISDEEMAQPGNRKSFKVFQNKFSIKGISNTKLDGIAAYVEGHTSTNITGADVNNTLEYAIKYQTKQIDKARNELKKAEKKQKGLLTAQERYDTHVLIAERFAKYQEKIKEDYKRTIPRREAVKIAQEIKNIHPAFKHDRNFQKWFIEKILKDKDNKVSKFGGMLDWADTYGESSVEGYLPTETTDHRTERKKEEKKKEEPIEPIILE